MFKWLVVLFCSVSITAGNFTAALQPVPPAISLPALEAQSATETPTPTPTMPIEPSPVESLTATPLDTPEPSPTPEPTATPEVTETPTLEVTPEPLQ